MPPAGVVARRAPVAERPAAPRRVGCLGKSADDDWFMGSGDAYAIFHDVAVDVVVACVERGFALLLCPVVGNDLAAQGVPGAGLLAVVPYLPKHLVRLRHVGIDPEDQAVLLADSARSRFQCPSLGPIPRPRAISLVMTA